MIVASAIADKAEEWRGNREIPINEFAAKIRMSGATYRRRIKKPSTFTIAEVERIEKLTKLSLFGKDGQHEHIV